MKNEILNKVLQIEKKLPNEFISKSLFDGEAGKAMFYGYLSNYLGNNKFDEQIEQSIVKIFDGINDGNIGYTFCTGLSGIMWSIEHMKRKGFIELEEKFEEITTLLKHSVLEYSKHGNFDFLHGADGIVYGLLLSDSIEEEFLDIWLSLLLKFSRKKDEGYVWETVIDHSTGKRGLNLSMSHGISSKIVVISEALRKYPQNKLALQLLNGSVNYLLHSKKDSNSNCCFPSYIDDGNSGMHSRLAWCYGDLGNAIALWKAGNTLNNSAWKSAAIDIMLHASKRRSLDKEHVLDAGFCHGSAGIAHVFNRFYKETGIKEFDDARLFWLNKTLEMAHFEDGIAGYKFFDGLQKKFIEQYNFLEGVLGVAMVLLGFLSDDQIDISWDECYLLN